jgi:hypothetical protein
MRAETAAVGLGAVLVGLSCGPELTVGDITGKSGTASGTGGTASGTGGTASGTGGTASGTGGTASGTGGAGGAAVCNEQPKAVDQWAHWTVPGDSPGAVNYDTSVAGVVADKTTGLVWQADIDPASFTWGDAVDYCKKPHAGHCDWRLPTRMELLTLVDYGKSNPASSFPKMPSDWFWSSSVSASAPSDAWYVNFGLGFVYTVGKGGSNRVRCVR